MFTLVHPDHSNNNNNNNKRKNSIMTCIVNLQIPVKKEAKSKFFADFATLLVATRSRPDCLWLYLADNDETGQVEVVSMWTSKAAYEEYLNWRMSYGALDGLADVLEGEPVWRYLDVRHAMP